jgi:F-type H+-transporting ATPase subunit gamma
VFYAGKQVDVFAIGKKGNDVLVKTSVVIDNQSAVYDDLTFDNVAVIADALMEKFVSGDYDKIELIYNHFKMPQRKLFKRSNSYHWQQYNQI